MKSVRDLKPEISHEESVAQVAATIAEFMDVHTTSKKVSNALPRDRLLHKMATTQVYLQPLLEAMELEGSYHMGTPRYDLEDQDNTNNVPIVEGSPWAAKLQHEFAPRLEAAVYANTTDEFHQSWWINPFHDPPFYHPTVNAKPTGDNKVELEMKTVSEAVYEKTDYFFDGGFFSNAAVEIRAKFNSPQAILQAAGVSAPAFDVDDNVASRMNAQTIEWALAHAPPVVRQRYERHGVKMVAGRDIPHNSGPGWIWSHLHFRRGTTHPAEPGQATEDCVYIDSHTMITPLDHPVPFAGGKMYCKLLSPAKALDWMYTDSLRPVWSLDSILEQLLFPRQRPTNTLTENVAPEPIPSAGRTAEQMP